MRIHTVLRKTPVLFATVCLAVLGACNSESKCAKVTCTALDDCHDVGVCDSSTGVCSNPLKSAGSSCNDHDGCTTGDHCNANGVCSGTAVACDARTCQTGTCQSSGDDAHTCNYVASSASTACTPAGTYNHCFASYACDGQGACKSVAASAVDCVGGDCYTGGTCNSNTGLCENGASKPDNTACDDKNACTGGAGAAVADHCVSGQCTGGTAKAAPALTACQASATCDPASGNFTFANKADNAPCTTSNLCKTGEVCTAGVCGGGAAVVCTQPANSCMAVAACAPATGCPDATPVATGTSCTGTDKCMQENACDGSGHCVGSSPKSCDTNPCSTGSACDSTDGQCKGGTAKPDTTTCSVDGSLCYSDHCQSGACARGSPKCASGQTCDAQTGTCSLAPPVTPAVVRDIRVQQNGGMATDTTGATYLASALTNLSPIDFDGHSLATTGDTDFFLAKYDTTGKAVWAVGIGDAAVAATPQYATCAAITNDGTLAFTGRFSGEIVFGANDVVAASESDMIGGVSAADGTPMWAAKFNTGTNGKLLSIAANPSSTANRVAVCGKVDSRAATDFAGTGTTLKGLTDILVGAFNSQTGARIGASSWAAPPMTSATWWR